MKLESQFIQKKGQLPNEGGRPGNIDTLKKISMNANRQVDVPKNYFQSHVKRKAKQAGGSLSQPRDKGYNDSKENSQVGLNLNLKNVLKTARGNTNGSSVKETQRSIHSTQRNQRNGSFSKNPENIKMTSMSPQVYQSKNELQYSRKQGCPSINNGIVNAVKNGKSKSKKRDSSINKANIPKPKDPSLTLNQLLHKQGSGTSHPAGPKLFIKQSQNNYDHHQNQLTFENQMKHHFTEVLPSFVNSYDAQNNHMRNHESFQQHPNQSQEDLYKSAPVRNTKRNRMPEGKQTNTFKPQHGYKPQGISNMMYIDPAHSMPEIQVHGHHYINKVSPHKFMDQGTNFQGHNFAISPNIRARIQQMNQTDISSSQSIKLHNPLNNPHIHSQNNSTNRASNGIDLNMSRAANDFPKFPLTSHSLKNKYVKEKKNDQFNSLTQRNYRELKANHTMKNESKTIRQQVSLRSKLKERGSKKLIHDPNTHQGLGPEHMISPEMAIKQSNSLSAVQNSQQKNIISKSYRGSKKDSNLKQMEYITSPPIGEYGTNIEIPHNGTFAGNYKSLPSNDRKGQFKTLQDLQQDLYSNIARKRQNKMDNKYGSNGYAYTQETVQFNNHNLLPLGDSSNLARQGMYKNMKIERNKIPLDNANLTLSHEPGDIQELYNPNINSERQVESKTVSLTDQIRKVNKIQIKKRFKKSVEISSLVNQARSLLEVNQLDKALEKYLEYLQLNPLDQLVHFEIGELYRSLLQCNKRKMDYIDEAIMHFEQVIKLNQRPKGELERGNQKQTIESEDLAAKALFEIVKIRIEQRDFYQANFEIQRASHFNFDSDSFKKSGLQFDLYNQFVQAVILLMKRKTIAGNDILVELIEKCNQSTSKDKMLSYFIYLYKCYTEILMHQYTKAVEFHTEAVRLQKFNENLIDIQSFVKVGEYNRQLALMLNINPKKMLDEHTNERLNSIVNLKHQFPLNKEVIRYNSIYLIKMQIEKENQQYMKCIKLNRKNELIQNLKENKPKEQVKKSRSQKLQGLELQPEESDKAETNLEIGLCQKNITCNIDHPHKQKVLAESLEIIQHGISFSPKDRNLLLARSHIYYYQHKFYESLCDIEAVIEIERASSGEEEPNATDLLHQGRCHACLSMFKEAIQDFTKVIELDEELFDAYFMRGKCSYLVGDTSQAFLDFQKLIMLQPKNPMVHAFAGNLLMTTGSYDDATKAFSNADKVFSCPFALYQRSRCHLALGEIKNAMNDLYEACSKYEKQGNSKETDTVDYATHPNPIVLRDKLCLELILNIINFLDGDSMVVQAEGLSISTPNDSQLDIDSHKSGTKSDAGKSKEIVILPQTAIDHNDFQYNFTLLDRKYTEIINIEGIEIREVQKNMPTTPHKIEDNFAEEISNNFSKITFESRLQQQIIPNVNRIKLEKVRALLRKQEKAKTIELAAQKKKKADMTTFSITDLQADIDLRVKGESICPWSYYMENMFSLDDLFLYRGVLRFYAGKFQEAINDFQQSFKVKNLQKVLDNQMPKDQVDDDINYDSGDEAINLDHSASDDEINMEHSMSSEQTDLSDIGLCSLNSNERLFNIMLCLVKMNRLKKAYVLLKRILKTCPSKYQNNLYKLKYLLKMKLFKNPDSSDYYAGPLLIEPFNVQSRLCRLYPYVEFNFNEDISDQPSFISRPSFSFPFVKPPNMIPNVDESFLITEFGTLTDPSSYPKPQALWIKIQEFHDQATRAQKPKAQTSHKEVVQYFQFTDTIIHQSNYVSSQTNSVANSHDFASNHNNSVRNLEKAHSNFNIGEVEVEIKQPEQSTHFLLKDKEISQTKSTIMKKSMSMHQR